MANDIIFSFFFLIDTLWFAEVFISLKIDSYTEVEPYFNFSWSFLRPGMMFRVVCTCIYSQDFKFSEFYSVKSDRYKNEKSRIVKNSGNSVVK